MSDLKRMLEKVANKDELHILQQERITLLEQENKKLSNFCKEFVYMEDNPKEHESMHKKITLLEQELKRLREPIWKEYKNKEIAELKERIKELERN